MISAKYIADRIRLMIATKQFQVGETLPSTRVLGKQLNASFHTVRKAYQMLMEEGLLNSHQGRGFVVARQNTRLDKSERLEKGAQKFRALLEELIGYGLDEEEVETLFMEQLSFMEWPERLNTIACVSETKEIAGMISDAIKQEIGLKTSLLSIEESAKIVNFDAIFVGVEHYRTFQSEADDTAVLPLIYSFNHEFTLSMMERMNLESIGLITVEEKSISVLMNEIKHEIKFDGTITGGVITGKNLPLLVHEVDLVLYTAGSAPLVEKQLPPRKRAKIEYELSSKTATMIRSELWDD